MTKRKTKPARGGFMNERLDRPADPRRQAEWHLENVAEFARLLAGVAEDMAKSDEPTADLYRGCDELLREAAEITRSILYARDFMGSSA